MNLAGYLLCVKYTLPEKNEPRPCQLYWVTAASNKAGARSGS